VVAFKRAVPAVAAIPAGVRGCQAASAWAERCNLPDATHSGSIAVRGALVAFPAGRAFWDRFRC
jgi:hypothetical protein